MVERKFALKLPVQVFAYLITKQLCNEKLLLIVFFLRILRVAGEFDRSCFTVNNKTS